MSLSDVAYRRLLNLAERADLSPSAEAVGLLLAGMGMAEKRWRHVDAFLAGDGHPTHDEFGEGHESVESQRDPMAAPGEEIAPDPSDHAPGDVYNTYLGRWVRPWSPERYMTEED